MVSANNNTSPIFKVKHWLTSPGIRFLYICFLRWYHNRLLTFRVRFWPEEKGQRRRREVEIALWCMGQTVPSYHLVMFVNHRSSTIIITILLFCNFLQSCFTKNDTFFSRFGMASNISDNKWLSKRFIFGDSSYLYTVYKMTIRMYSNIHYQKLIQISSVLGRQKWFKILQLWIKVRSHFKIFNHNLVPGRRLS